MEQTLRLAEADFYSDSEHEEDFSQFFTDDEEAHIPLEKSPIVELPEDYDAPVETAEERRDIDDSLFDSLLGEALSGEEVNPPIDGLFDDLDEDDEPEEIDRSQLEDIDSGIGPSPSASEESAGSPSTIDMSSIANYLEYMKEEEHAVLVDEIPDFASKKNVYGTSFSVRTGAIHRPPRFEFARRDTQWIDSCKDLTYEKKKPVDKLLTLGKVVSSIKLGTKIDVCDRQYTDVYCRTAEEMAAMETHHIQQIIRDAFNSRRLAVLLLGVDKKGKVTGCRLNAGKQDNLRLALDTAIQTEFSPPIENVLDAIDIKFAPVEDVADTFFIVIRIKQLRNQTYRLESAQMSTRQCTLRYGTSLMPFFAKQISAVPPTESDFATSTLFPDRRIAESPELSVLRRPSLSAVLSAISDQKALYLWQKAQIDEMGISAFKASMNDRMVLGTKVHTKCEEMLKLRAADANEQDLVKLIDVEKNAAVRNFMKSALPVILEIQKPKTAICEQKVRHPKLAYQGRFDAVVQYKENWSILDWKTAPARSSFSTQGEHSLSYVSYVRQLAAYASAYNYDVRFQEFPIAKTGVLASLKEDGSPADVYEIPEADMKQTMEEVKGKLKEFWNRVMTAEGINVDFAYKPAN
ncbi:unnamed protein product [Caenorhabditis sp. 36 PRJEB53466]|nr:unnamed protein product [Caenorhabditis sp. 36 PRJEB53466]